MLTFPRQTLGIGLLCRLSAHIAAPRGDGRRRLPGHRGGCSPLPTGTCPHSAGAWGRGPGGWFPHTCPSGTGQTQRPACPGGSAARSHAAVTAGWPRGWDGDAVHGQGAEQRRAGCQRSRTEDATAGSTSRSAPGLLPRREPPELREQSGCGAGGFPHPTARPDTGQGQRCHLCSWPRCWGQAGGSGSVGRGLLGSPPSEGHPYACPAHHLQPGGVPASPVLQQLLPQKPTEGCGGGLPRDMSTWRAEQVPWGAAEVRV